MNPLHALDAAGQVAVDRALDGGPVARVPLAALRAHQDDPRPVAWCPRLADAVPASERLLAYDDAPRRAADAPHDDGDERAMTYALTACGEALHFYSAPQWATRALEGYRRAPAWLDAVTFALAGGLPPRARVLVRGGARAGKTRLAYALAALAGGRCRWESAEGHAWAAARRARAPGAPPFELVAADVPADVHVIDVASERVRQVARSEYQKADFGQRGRRRAAPVLVVTAQTAPGRAAADAPPYAGEWREYDAVLALDAWADCPPDVRVLRAPRLAWGAEGRTTFVSVGAGRDDDLCDARQVWRGRLA